MITASGSFALLAVYLVAFMKVSSTVHDGTLMTVGPYELPHSDKACLLGVQRDSILGGTGVNCHVRDRRKGGKGKPKAKGTKKKPAAALPEEGEDEEEDEGDEEDPVAEEVAEEEAEEAEHETHEWPPPCTWPPRIEAAAQRAHLFAQLPPTPEKKLDPEQVKIDFKMKRSHKGATVVVFRKRQDERQSTASTEAKHGDELFVDSTAASGNYQYYYYYYYSVA